MAGPVVTVSRQHGSGGEEVARLVAERLGATLLDNELRQRAAARAGVPERAAEDAERPTSFINRVLERLGTVGMMADGGAIEHAMPLAVPTQESFRAVLGDVVYEAAADGGVVLIGHAAHLTLRDMPGVVRVFVQAPLDARVTRIVRQQHISDTEARRQVEQQDRDRVRFYQDTYHVNWFDTRLYDCVVDTHLLGVHGAADMVLEMVEKVCMTRPEATAPVESAVRVPGAADAAPERASEPAPARAEGQVTPIRDGTVCIRPMSSGDGAALLSLFQSLPPADLLFLRRNATDPLAIEAWERDVVDGRMLTILAESMPEDGSPAVVLGEASLRPSDVPWTSHVGEVRVVIAPEQRDRGLGEKLMREVMRAAEDAGIEKLTAETMAEQSGAQRLLKRLGFIEEGRYKGHARDQTGKAHDLVVLTYTRDEMANEMDVVSAGVGSDDGTG